MMIEGVTPASKGWCSAECDLPGEGPALPHYVEVTGGDGGCQLVTPTTIQNIVINGTVKV